MLLQLKKLSLNIAFNFILFFILVIGIQNSVNRKKVNFIFGETISLPISFIVGVSFISGSLTGTLITISPKSKKL